ncbi:MAG: hypothetical protein Kow00106_21500 [Anaerolineae bacterium]
MNGQQVACTVGPYELLDRLGSGGMGHVYRARLPGEGPAALAIKVVSLHSSPQRAAQRQNFLREAQTATRLRHPHILPVYDYGESNGQLYLVMKLVEGGTLADRIAQGPLPLGDVAAILTQVAGALDYAHARGVIHRDIKPQNILFDTGGDAYLSDFGVAQHNPRVGTGGTHFIGTAAYASPEQCRGEELTSASDLYALGVVTFEMLTGELPFQGATVLALMHQHLHQPPPDPCALRPELPPAIAEVVQRALAKRPSARYRSAASFSGALNRALYSPPAPAPLLPPRSVPAAPLADTTPARPTPFPPDPSPATTMRHRRRRLVLSAVFALLTLASVAALLLTLL